MKFHDDHLIDSLIEATLRDVAMGFHVSVMHLSPGEMVALDESELFVQVNLHLTLSEKGHAAADQLADEAENNRCRE